MEFVEHLKSSVDIVGVIGRYVSLRKASQNRYTGLCPFHTEKTASFSVNSSLQIYKCFGCGVGGDVIKFVMEHDRLTFPEALQQLADSHGIAMPARREHDDPETRLRAALYEMHSIAADVFRSNLSGTGGTEARAYLAKRGVTPGVAEQFGLGFSDRSGQALTRRLQQQGFPTEQLEASGLVLKRADGSGLFDRFRGRLMFPIHNDSGKPIAFGGRALSPEDEPKYLNSSETAIYKKSHTVYNLHRAKDAIRKHKNVVLVEGYMDVIGVHAAGIEEVVASCGTALTPSQVKTISRQSGRIVVNFDPDNAGANAAEKSIQILLEENMHVRILQLEGGLDPDEYVREAGADAYRERLAKAGGYFSWLAERARKRFDMDTAEGRMEGFRTVLLPAVQRIHDKLERAAVADEIAGYLRIERSLVLKELRLAPVTRMTRAAPKANDTLPPLETQLIRSLIASAEIRSLLIPALRSSRLAENSSIRAVFAVIFALHDSNGRITYEDVAGRLEDRDKTLLENAIFADNTQEIATAEQADALLRQVEQEAMQHRIAALKEQIREAERARNFELAMRLTEELGTLKRRSR